MCNVKPLSVLGNRQEEDSLFVYFAFYVWTFYCRCCTGDSVTLDTSFMGKRQDFKSKRRNSDLSGGKGRIWILYVTHLPFLFSDVTDKGSQGITEDLSMRKATT